jgi:hypothetical protein
MAETVDDERLVGNGREPLPFFIGEPLGDEMKTRHFHSIIPAR